MKIKMSAGVRVPRARQKGVALVIVLAFIVLLTGLVVAYFSRSMTDRQTSNGSFNETKANILARSAADVVIGDLKQEIVDGSTPVTVPGGDTIYTVLNTNLKNMLPQRSGNPAVTTTDPAPNLIRRSVRSDSIAAPGVGSRASTISSMSVSRNGRFVTKKRWNSHYLIPRASAGSSTASAIDSTPIAAFDAPDWVIATKNGPVAFSAWNATLSDPANSNFALGRYAYAIYDEGGLLDVNAAGYPSNATAAQVGNKSALALADLTVTSMTKPQIDNLVGWRNYASSQPQGTYPSLYFDGAGVTNYFDYLKNITTGFRTAALASRNGKTDQIFLSRQQLLAFMRSTGVSQDALQYLGTFSRDIEQPSFAPDAGRPVIVGGITAGGNDAVGSDDAINPSLLTVRVATTLAGGRYDGTDLAVGEPLVKKRFPLSRLGLFSYTATSATSANIYKYFGLARTGVDDTWVYNHGKAGIYRLSEVAALNPPREPDFAELLKAALCVGSLARGANQQGYDTGVLTPGPGARQNTIDTSVDFHVIQIMANIIDQADADSYPTSISVNGTAFSGVEDLPYIAGIRPMPVKVTSSQGYITVNPEIWKPHDQTYPRSAARPTAFQVTMDSVGANIKLSRPNSGGSTPAIYWSPPTDKLSFADTAGFAVNPTLISELAATNPNAFSALAADTQVTSFTGKIDAAGQMVFAGISPARNFIGFKSGDFNWGSVFTGNTAQLLFSAGGPITMSMAYISPSGASISYQQVVVPIALGGLMGVRAPNGGQSDATFGYRRVDSYDPRTSRFGTEGGVTNGVANSLGNSYDSYLSPYPMTAPTFPYDPQNVVSQTAPYKDTSAYGIGRDGGQGQPSGTGWNLGGVNVSPAYIAQNKPTMPQYYADADGVVRKASGGDADNLGKDAFGNPSLVGLAMATSGNASSRPIVLNRSFKSVAELGYVFRSTPWKNIDFFNPESGDTALLDVFCLNENTQPNAVVAGKLNLNTRQPVALAAVLGGAFKDVAASSTASSAEATALAAALTARTTGNASGQGPLRNVGELVGHWVSGSGTSAVYHGFSEDLTNPAYANAADPKVQRLRETAIRALADIGQTRVWNVMIDVIAQSGRYPPGANGLGDFVVEGEQHCWMHVAIDRYTGQVIDQNVEVVKE